MCASRGRGSQSSEPWGASVLAAVLWRRCAISQRCVWGRIALSCGLVTRRDVPCAQDELSPVNDSIQMGITAFPQKPSPAPSLLDPECHEGGPPPAYTKPSPFSSLIEPDSDTPAASPTFSSRR